jgi:hypothetical protein
MLTLLPFRGSSPILLSLGLVDVLPVVGRSQVLDLIAAAEH